MKKINLLFVFAFICLFATVNAQSDRVTEPGDDHPSLYGRMFAQDFPEGNEMFAKGKGAFQGEGKQRRKHLDQLRVLKMLELLDLNDKQEIPFLTAFHDTRTKMKELGQQKQELLEQLTPQLHESKPNEENILSLVDEIMGIDEKMTVSRHEFVKLAGTLLTPGQLGRLIVFQERFDAELLEQVRHFQGRRNKGKHEMPNQKGF